MGEMDAAYNASDNQSKFQPGFQKCLRFVKGHGNFMNLGKTPTRCKKPSRFGKDGSYCKTCMNVYISKGKHQKFTRKRRLAFATPLQNNLMKQIQEGQAKSE